MSRKRRKFHRLFTPLKLGKCLKWRVMATQGMAESMIWQIKIMQMQLIINFLRELHRRKCIKILIVTGAILLKVTKLFSWAAHSTAVSVFKKLNRDTLRHKFPPPKFNLRKVGKIAKLAPYRKMRWIFHNNLSLSKYTVTKVKVPNPTIIVQNDTKIHPKEC